jgi:hypothetical protein
MTDEQKFEGMEDEYVDIYTLTDEETGEEMEFELLAEADIDGQHYVALEPMDEALRELGQYVILRMEGEGDDAHFVSFDDEEETFDKVAEFFDDLFFEDVDYDQE